MGTITFRFKSKSDDYVLSGVDNSTMKRIADSIDKSCNERRKIYKLTMVNQEIYMAIDDISFILFDSRGN